jgi:hypothetical protein
MQTKSFLLILSMMVVLGAAAQAKRYDSTMKLGKTGYKVFCTNKNADKNSVNISPMGFEKEAREVSIEVKGRVVRAEVDDLNRDGFPDLVIYVYNGGTKNTGTVVGISSEKNQSFAPIVFPDIVDDAKLRVGYAGNDEFRLMEGFLVRRFPVYDMSDTANIRPTGITRQVMYNVIPGDRGYLKFKVMRSYELGKTQAPAQQ